MNFEAKLALEVIEAERVSAFLGITTMLNWMMAVRRTSRATTSSSLRNIQYGGGPMPSSVVKAALRGVPVHADPGLRPDRGDDDDASSPRRTTPTRSTGVHPERLRSCGREGFVTIGAGRRRRRARRCPRDGATAGQIVVRSEANMVGYWQPPRPHRRTPCATAGCGPATSPPGTRTRYVFIVDRAKDMIISGGENIYSVQVEEADRHAPGGARVRGHRRPRRGVGRVGQGVRRAQAGHDARPRRRSSTRPGRTWRRTRSRGRSSSSPSCPRRRPARSSSATLRDPYWAERGRSV